MTDRYLAWLAFQVQLDDVRWKLITIAALYGVGFLATFIFPLRTRRWAQPAYEIVGVALVYTLMILGQLYAR